MNTRTHLILAAGCWTLLAALAGFGGAVLLPSVTERLRSSGDAAAEAWAGRDAVGNVKHLPKDLPRELIEHAYDDPTTEALRRAVIRLERDRVELGVSLAEMIEMNKMLSREAGDFRRRAEASEALAEKVIRHLLSQPRTVVREVRPPESKDAEEPSTVAIPAAG